MFPDIGHTYNGGLIYQRTLVDPDETFRFGIQEYLEADDMLPAWERNETFSTLAELAQTIHGWDGVICLNDGRDGWATTTLFVG